MYGAFALLGFRTAHRAFAIPHAPCSCNSNTLVLVTPRASCSPISAVLLGIFLDGVLEHNVFIGLLIDEMVAAAFGITTEL